MLASVAVEGRSDEGMAIAVLRAAGIDARRVLSADGKTRLDPKIPGYMKAAAFEPWVVFRDSDGVCPVDLRNAVTGGQEEPERFVLRIACTMTEAWLLGDHSGFADYFCVPAGSLPNDPEVLPHAKSAVLTIMSRSRDRGKRSGMLSEGGTTAGPQYVHHLNTYALSAWNPDVAAQRCPSLARALVRLRRLAETG